MSAKASHPWPWKWIPEVGDTMPALVDANGDEIFNFGNARQYYPSEGSPPEDPRILELLRAAPELADVLADVLDAAGTYLDLEIREKAETVLGRIREPQPEKAP